MSIQFSDTTNNTGIVQQVRSLMRVDANQWPTWKIVNSVNNWHDFVVGYAIGADRRFEWDDTNHTDLPEGTQDLSSGVSDYSFLTDEQGNPIITLTGIAILINGKYQSLDLVDRNDASYDLASFGTVSGTPTAYDKIADNIIRLDRVPTQTTAEGIKFFFQRAGVAFTASDTTQTPGVSPLLHRGYVIAAAYDGALTLGLPTLAGLSADRGLEVKKVENYFSNDRNNDDTRPQLTMKKINYI